ncbi:MAG: putative F420-dependent oxidoreductase [Thermoproteota archaeon]|jgi:probable F420-dependent oxidoreductase
MSDLEIGVLFGTDRMSGADFIGFGKRVESAGLHSVWLAELFGREPFAAAAALLANTESLVVGTAIANIYGRDAVATAAASATLAELSGNRFHLGLGVSNKGLVGMRGHDWQPPVPLLTGYLDQLASAKIDVPANEYPVLVAAHGPKMLAAASAGADGVFTYLMNPEHTARTVASVADTPTPTMVSPMMMCLRCLDASEARSVARKAIAYYLTLGYYHRAWRTLGFDDDDFVGGGSDRLVDSIVAWGSMDAIQHRLAAQADAGASRVIVVPLNAAGGGHPDWNLLRELGASATMSLAD